MMGRLWCSVGRLRVGIGLALLAAMLAVPAVALADRDDNEGRKQNLNCPGKHTLVRIDEATCPPTNDRPLIVRKRACCMNPAGKVHCDHFEHCPNKSPS